MKFISKFEAENTIITEFGKNLEYWQRIEAIQKTLETYNQEVLEQKKSRIEKTGAGSQ